MTATFLSIASAPRAELQLAESSVGSLLQNRAFRRQLSEAQFEELNSLSRERDANLLGEALYSFAFRQEQEGHTELALTIYHAFSGIRVSQTLLSQVETRMNALSGIGPWQNRLEGLGRRFVAQATDPAMILAFGLAGGIANLVRGGTMASLALRAPSFLSRGFGARLLAGATSYFAEVPTFVGANRVTRHWLNPEVEGASWGEELASAALFLGVLRLTGGAAETCLRGREVSPAVRGGVSVFAQLGGIYSAHALQENFGLRAAGGATNRMVDTVDSFLQMQVGGRLLGGALPDLSPRLSGILENVPMEAGDTGAETLPLRGSSRQAWSMPSERLAASRREGNISANSSVSNSSPEAEQAARREILQRFERDEAVGVIQSYEAIAKLLETPLDATFSVGRPWLDMEGGRLFRGLRRLRHAAQYSSADGLQGNYLNWLLRLSMHEAIRQNRSDWGLRLIEGLEIGASVETLETLLAEQLPSFDLYQRGVVRGAPTRDIPLTRTAERAIQSLPLSSSAKEILVRFARYQGEIPLEFFGDLGERLGNADPVSRLIEPILLGVRESPVAYLRLVRLFQILEHDSGITAKLFELNDPQLRLWSDRQREFGSHAFLRSQGDGYLAEMRWTEYLNQLHGESGLLRRPLDAMARRERTEEVLRAIWPEPRELTPEDLTRALESLGDPMSLRVATALRAGQVELRLLSDVDFTENFARLNGNHRGDLVQAFLLPASEGVPRDQLILRQIHRASDIVFRRLLIERLVHAVHEFDHHLHPPQTPRSDLSALREELPAHLRHIQYRARLGEPQELEAMFSESPAGPALFLRDKVEAAYFRRYLHHPVNSAAMALEPSEVAERLGGLGEQSDYIRGLLNLGARSVDAFAGDSSEPLHENLLDWLQEADWALGTFQRDLFATRGAFNISERLGSPVSEESIRNFERFDADFTRWRRVSHQIRSVYEISLRPPTDHGEVEIRRRRDWLASLGLFGMEAPLSSIPASEASRRLEVGLDLLRQFHPNFRGEQVEIYERAARGSIRNRDIAFDLDKTLGDTFRRYLAEDAFRAHPELYDVRMEDFIHQYTLMRLPYRGIQAMLLGLWAAGNRVRLYTASENLVGNHDVFFNDFPLIKVAMEIVPPAEAHRLVTPEELHAAPHFMDKLKFREYYSNHFGDETGQSFLGDLAREQGLRKLPDLTVAKLPFPGFPFDVLVDDLYYFAGDLMTVGLGRRFVLAEGDTAKILKGLERYFSLPLPVTSPLWTSWLRGSSER